MSQTPDSPDNAQSLRIRSDQHVHRLGAEAMVLNQGTDPRQFVLDLEKHREQQNEEVGVREAFFCVPTDGAIAMKRALERVCGFTNLTTTPTKNGEEPPQVIRVRTSANTYEDCVWGRMEIPGIDGYIEPSLSLTANLPTFVVEGRCKQSSKPQIDMITAEMRKILAEESIYKGKTIKLELASIDDFGQPRSHSEFEFDWDNDQPTFVDVSKYDISRLSFNPATAEQLKDQLFGFIQYNDEYMKLGIPSCRTVMLSGGFGTGKTLTASALCRTANECGWTAIYVTHIKSVFTALKLAETMQPVVIFIEDIDTMLPILKAMPNYSGFAIFKRLGEVLDGIDAKNLRRLIVATTNHLNDIPSSFIRPGRFDSIIHYQPLETDTTEAIIRKLFGDLMDPTEDLSQVLKVLGNKPVSYISCLVNDVKARVARRNCLSPAMRGDKITASTLLDVQSLYSVNSDAPKEFSTHDSSRMIPGLPPEILGGVFGLINDVISGKEVTRGVLRITVERMDDAPPNGEVSPPDSEGPGDN